MNIILIGPVSDNVERAKRVFALAEKLLTEAGHTVVHNPMRDHVPGLTEAQYMARSLTAICGLKDLYKTNLEFFSLPYSVCSMGAQTEAFLCVKLAIGNVANIQIHIKLDQEHNRKEVTTNDKES